MHKILFGILLLILSGCNYVPGATPPVTQPATSTSAAIATASIVVGPSQPAVETPVAAPTGASPLATTALQGDIPYIPGAGLPPGLVYRLGLTGLWIIDANGQPQQLNDGYQPVLSPDGTQVLYNIAYEGDIWLADLQTDEKRNLTNTPDVEERDYAWWPGKPGTVLFYYRPMNEGGMSSGSLGMARTDGSGYQVIDASGGSLGIAAPSPDGQTIALDQEGRPALYTAGQGVQPLNLADYGIQAERAINPAWSPDGKRLAWVIADGGQNGVAVLDLNGKQGMQLHSFSAGIGGEMQPKLAWSPDGSRLALVSFEAGRSAPVVWVLSEDASEEIAVGNGVDPVWSPDGRFLVYTYTPPSAGSFTEDQVLVVQVGVWQAVQVLLETGAHPIGWVRVQP